MKNYETKDLGLAAYILMKDYTLEKCENRVFFFKNVTKEDGDRLSVEYANSCCRKHDANIMFLRQLL